MSSSTKPSSDLMIAALVAKRHRHLFDTAQDKANDSGDVGAYNFLHTCPASHGDRLALGLAFACWRGYGPAIQVDELWGMDPAVAQRVLAALALATAGPDAPGILKAAAARCRELLPSTEESEDE
jgi:hypothetical protein